MLFDLRVSGDVNLYHYARYVPRKDCIYKLLKNDTEVISESQIKISQ